MVECVKTLYGRYTQWMKLFMLTKFVLLSTLLSGMAENIHPVLALEVNRILAISVEDNRTLPREGKMLNSAKESYHKRHVREYHEELSEDNDEWPVWAENNSTVSSSIETDDGYGTLENDIDVLKSEYEETLEPVEDNRVITTLMYSQMHVKPLIVHGKAANAKDFPFVVSLKRVVKRISETEKMWTNYCGGSIIGSSKVLTAAHCFELNDYDYYDHPNKLRVVAGTIINKLHHSGNTSDTNQHQVRQIKRVKLHQDFNFPMNDIALVFVNKPFKFNLLRNINYIVPARSNKDYASQCYAAGFGQSKPKSKEDGSSKLLWAQINVMAPKQCSEIWDMDMLQFLCSRFVVQGVSGGDSGGPLACQNTHNRAGRRGSGKILVGIVSGRNYDKTLLYTRVSAYRDWIDSNGSVNLKSRLWVFCALIKSFCIWLC